MFVHSWFFMAFQRMVGAVSKTNQCQLCCQEDSLIGPLLQEEIGGWQLVGLDQGNGLSVGLLGLQSQNLVAHGVFVVPQQHATSDW